MICLYFQALCVRHTKGFWKEAGTRHCACPKIALQILRKPTYRLAEGNMKNNGGNIPACLFKPPLSIALSRVNHSSQRPKGQSKGYFPSKPRGADGWPCFWKIGRFRIEFLNMAMSELKFRSFAAFLLFLFLIKVVYETYQHALVLRCQTFEAQAALCQFSYIVFLCVHDFLNKGLGVEQTK